MKLSKKSAERHLKSGFARVFKFGDLSFLEFRGSLYQPRKYWKKGLSDPCELSEADFFEQYDLRQTYK